MADSVFNCEIVDSIIIYLNQVSMIRPDCILENLDLELDIVSCGARSKVQN